MKKYQGMKTPVTFSRFAGHRRVSLIDTGAKYIEKSTYELDYVKVGIDLSKGIVISPFLFYESAEQVLVTDGKILGEIYEPYFNRTYGHYCSHQNTPNKLEAAQYPAAVRKGNVVYLAHQICKLYFEHGAQYHRDYFINVHTPSVI